MAEGNFSLQAQWKGVGAGGGEGMRQQQVNSKKILIALFINYVSSCQQHIKAELGSEAPELIWFPGIHIVMLCTVQCVSFVFYNQYCLLFMFCQV
jgi:hypothetical protein